MRAVDLFAGAGGTTTGGDAALAGVYSLIALTVRDRLEAL